jgi:hypothetical protein
MQVKEIDPTTTSIKWFVVMAIGVTALSYSVRLLIRSSVFIEPRQKMMASVRLAAEIPVDRDVPLRAFLGWAFGWVFQKLALTRVGRVVGVLLCTIIPLIPLWSSESLGHGMKAAMSINLSIVGALLIAALTITAALSRKPSWRTQYIARRFTRSSPSVQRADEEQAT